MKKGSLSNKRMQDLIFCLIILFVPVLQFSIFYIGVNVNSFVMAFQKYEIDELTGFVPNVLFPCAALADTQGRVSIYYGAADSTLGIAFTTIDNLIEFAKKHNGQ